MQTPQLEITMLDGFSIRCGNRAVSDANGHSKKTWLLLAYLICNRGRAASREELVGLLWENEKHTANPANSVKATLFRARACLEQLWEGAGRQLVLSVGSGYTWNTQFPLTVDLEAFCGRCGPDQPLEALLEAIGMYRRGFLPRLTGNSWVGERAEEYLTLYLSAVDRAVSLLEKQERWKEVARLCEGAAEQAPLNEELYRRRMRALLQLGENRQAAYVYEDMSQLFMSRYQAMPSDETQALYRRARSNANARNAALDEIMGQLEEQGARGAFFCDYDVFRALYRLQVRDAGRTGAKGCVAVLTVEGRNGEELSRHSRDLVMANLRQLTPPLLRQGDAMARCSVCQYVLLLPGTSFETGQAVCRRTVKAFVRQYPHSPAEVRAAVCPWKAEGGKRQAPGEN